MAEEAQQQDRTEQPTPKRRADARKKGDVPRSRELTMTGVMLSGSAGLLLMAEPMGEKLLSAFAQGFVIEREIMFDTSKLAPAFAEIATAEILSILPFVGVLICAVFLSAACIGGWSFSMKACLLYTSPSPRDPE